CLKSGWSPRAKCRRRSSELQVTHEAARPSFGTDQCSPERQRNVRSASKSNGAEYSKQAKWVPEGIVIECLSRLSRHSSSRSESASVDVVSESPRTSRVGSP